MKIVIDQNRPRALAQRCMNSGTAIPTGKILALVAEKYRVPPDDLLGTSRVIRIVWVRQIMHWLLHALGHSAISIERQLKRGHSGVLHSIRTVEGYRESYPEIRAETDALRAEATATTKPAAQAAIQPGQDRDGTGDARPEGKSENRNPKSEIAA